MLAFLVHENFSLLELAWWIKASWVPFSAFHVANVLLLPGTFFAASAAWHPGWV